MDKLHPDCGHCFSQNVERIGEPYRVGDGLFVKVKCHDCHKISEVGDGDYFIEVEYEETAE